MSHDSSFDRLLARLRAGDDDAVARQLLSRFAGRLLSKARIHLDRRVRQKVDPEDVVQSAMKSFLNFLRRHQEGGFRLEDWDNVEGLLVRITLRKCWRQVQHYRRARRDERQEVPAPDPAESSEAGWEAVDRGPTPSQVALFNETLERMMCDLNGRERQILQLRLDGFTVPEISKEVGLTKYTVEGVLKQVRKRLRRLLNEDAQHL